MSQQSTERTLEWYRPALLGRLVLVWLVGAFFIGLGVVSSALAFDLTGRFPPEVQRIGLAVGVTCTVGGALFGLLGILRVLSADPVWLLLREDAVVFHAQDEEVTISWQALSGARWTGRVLILERDGGAPVEIRCRFMGTSGPALAARITEVQRQALMGVLCQRLE